MSIHAQLEATTNRLMPVLLLTLSVVSLASTETATAAGQGPGAGRWQHEAPEAHGLDSAMLKAAGDAVDRAFRRRA